MILLLICLIFSFDISAFEIQRASVDSNLEAIATTVNLAYQKQLFNRKDYPRITPIALKELLQNEENELYILLSNQNEVGGTVLLTHAVISLLSVHPQYQGQGLGKRLLNHAEHEAFKTYETVYLKTIPLFQENLIRFYESLGYTPCGVELLSEEKLERIQEQYRSEVYALVMKKQRP